MRERRRGLPAALFVIASAALLAIWQLAVAPRLPEQAFRNDVDRGPLVWVAPGVGRYFCREDLSKAELLIVGDSRVYNGVEPSVFDAAGLGPCAAIHGRAARLLDLLDAARLFPARRLVVALAPAGLRSPRMEANAFVLQQPLPAIRGDGMNFAPAPESEVGSEVSAASGPRVRRVERLPLERMRAEVATWRAAQRLRLEASSLHLGIGEKVLDEIVESMETEIRRIEGSRRELDRRGSHALDQWRRAQLRTIEATTWHVSWFTPIRPEGQDEMYRQELANVRDVAAAAERVGQRLSALVRDGWQVTCVRLPISPSLRAIEDAHVAPDVFEQTCARAGVPYIDFGVWGEHLRDGSHLTGPGCQQFSAELARRLAAGVH